MRLLFDLKSTQPQKHAKFHGAGKYGIAVFKKLVELAPNNVAVYYDEKVFLDPVVLKMIQEYNIPSYSSNKLTLYKAALKESSVLYVPMLGAHEYPLPPVGIHLATTQHDLRHFTLKRDSFYRFTDTRSFASIRYIFFKLKDFLVGEKKKEHIFRKIENFYNQNNVTCFTVSEHSKYCILDYCSHLSSGKLTVFWAPSTIDKTISLNNYNNPYGKYWLLVGVNRYEKNGLRAIMAFDQLFTRHPCIKGKVVVTGWSNWEQIKIFVKNKSRFVLLGYVDEITLKGLYHFAYSFVYPTLDEGFGYPPIEAMSEGCPVIASATSSITEICKDGVLYFNPYSIGEMRNRILQMENKNIHEYYIMQAKLRYKLVEEKQKKDLDALCNELLNMLKV